MIHTMKATEKIKLMMRLEKGFQKLDLEELHMIKDTLNKEIEKRELSSPEMNLFLPNSYTRVSI